MRRDLAQNRAFALACRALRKVPYASLLVVLVGCVGGDDTSSPPGQGSTQGGRPSGPKGSGGATSTSSGGTPGVAGLGGAPISTPGGSSSGTKNAEDGGAPPTSGGSSSAGAAGAAGSGTPVTRPAEGKPACGTGTIGMAKGNVVGNFMLQDQHGKTVWMSDFCDKTVFIEGAAMWCPYCREMAEELGKLYPKYKDKGLVVLTLLSQNNDYDSPEPPNTKELGEWADTFGLETTPVLSDSKGISEKLWRSSGFPDAKLLTPGAKIKVADAAVSDIERHFDP